MGISNAVRKILLLLCINIGVGNIIAANSISDTINFNIPIKPPTSEEFHLTFYNLYDNINENNTRDPLIYKFYKDTLDISPKSRTEALNLYKTIGIKHKQQGSLSQSLSYFFISLSLAENTKDTSELISSYNLICTVLNYSRRFDEFLKYNEKVELLLQKYVYPAERITYLINLGFYYEKTDRLQKALDTYLKADTLNKVLNDPNLQVDIYESIGSIYEDLDNNDTAEIYFKKALHLAFKQPQKNYLQIVNTLNNIGDCYFEKSKLDSALLIYWYAYDLGIKHTLKKEIDGVLKDIAKIYAEKGDFKKAQFYLNKHIKLYKKIYNEETSSQITQLQIQFDIEKKNQQIKLQQATIKSQHLSWLMMVISLSLVSTILIIVILAYRRQKKLSRKLKESNKKIKEQSIELRHSAEKYKDLNKTKDRFIDIIAHDLRNPFQAISGFSSLLNESFDEIDNEQRKKFVNLIETGANRVLLLVDNLLTWARTRNNRLSILKSSFDIQKVVNDIIKLSELSALQKNINLKSTIPTSTLVYADVNMIDFVVRNLISNAIKFSFIESEIIIESKVVDNGICISVKDQGVGITQDNIDNLFKLETQNRTKGTSGETGTGLGLLICKEYIEKNDGTFIVESKPNIGSIFKFTLPQG